MSTTPGSSMEPTEPSMSALESAFDEQKLMDVHEKYRIEREKRLRPDGIAQYAEFDPKEPLPNTSTVEPLPIKGKRRVVIVGAGFGGLLFAVRLIEKRYCTAKDILIVDEGKDFGGTWSWNRYPGLMCDIESYIYLPLLEETGYMPSGKYIGGLEIQQHAVRIAKKWDLVDQASFESSVPALVWDEKYDVWNVKVITPEGPGFLRTEVVYLATGLLNTPKIPLVDGLKEFKGKVIHSSRWDYDYTGGSWENPEMEKLKDKKIGVVGTGATGVQLIPELAKWAKEVVVFQRTPSSVFPRNDHTVHAESEFMGVGWQRKRMENFNAFISNEIPLPPQNLVNDAWSKMQSYSALIGGGPSQEAIEKLYEDQGQEEHLFIKYLGTLDKTFNLDLQAQEAVRARVSDIVHDKNTAEALTPYYYGWCKRPCFSDVFLQTFNEPHVTLVETHCKGLSDLYPDPYADDENGIMIDGTQYKLDAIVFCTGYHLGTAIDCSKISIIGCDGQFLHEKWQKNGVSTLHGVMTNGFPNLFFPGPYQAGATANQPYILDQMAIHVAAILSKAKEMSETYSTFELRFPVEAGENDEKLWTWETMRRAYKLFKSRFCTPGYLNLEGMLSKMDEEEAKKIVRASVWGTGVKDFVGILEEWRKSHMRGVVRLSIACQDEVDLEYPTFPTN